ncbi:ABC transporter permease [Deinococcus irradiatisoli]|uniref:ABC transporter permease n=1 Tax=Deinococcus irradiatisoli TaxID=2202254 RepID=A0A2Z3JP93_9DEIO|nr:ABC transporter permease [Deinococcus irradiatisoli]AWN23328.1 ABC transporter permease [Deinococcus irradiatisoli]
MSDSVRPSPLAARLSLIFAVVALVGLFLFPYGTLSRNFNAQSLLQRFPAGLTNFTGTPFENVPSVSSALAIGWATLLTLAACIYAAVSRARWLWIAGLLALLLGAAAIVVFNSSLNAAVAELVAQGVRARRIPWTSGGMHLGLFLPPLAGLVTIFAGLSMHERWWERLNRLRGLLVPVAAIALAIAVGALVVLVVQPVPNGLERPLSIGELLTGKLDVVWYVYTTLFAPITNLNGLFDSLKLATPLIFTGLGVAFGFRAGLFNIGGPGQLTMGGIAAMLVGVYAPLPAFLLLPATVLAAALGGAVWGAVPGLLKARFGSSEVINTIMLNYIASAVFIFLIGSSTFPFLGKTYTLPIKDEGFEAKSKVFQEGAQLAPIANWLSFTRGDTTLFSLGPVLALLVFAALYYGLRRVQARLWIALAAAVVVGFLTWHAVGVPVTGSFSASRLNTSFLIGLVCAVLMGVLLWRTSAGYALRAVGLSPAAAEYGGISVGKNVILAMTLSGALIGLGATHYTMGGALDEYRLKGNMPVNVGFDGIAVALMGQSTPGGVVAAAILFGTVDTGGVDVDRVLDKVNKDIVTVLKSLIVLFIAAGGFLSRRITDPPPPQLVKAVDASGSDASARLTPGEAAHEASTPLPNVGRSSEVIAQDVLGGDVVAEENIDKERKS